MLYTREYVDKIRSLELDKLGIHYWTVYVVYVSDCALENQGLELSKTDRLKFYTKVEDLWSRDEDNTDAATLADELAQQMLCE